jgi:colicin import membrane protein
VLSRDSIGGELLAVGDEYIVFEDKFFSLDRSRILYYFIAKCSDGRCQLSFFKINYLYQISSDQLSERYSAEEMISDAVGLKRGKLVKKNSKFRIKTIDLVDAAFAEVTGLLGQKLLAKLNQSK